MIRYALLALTLFLATDVFVSNPARGTVTAHALHSLTYAFTPAFIALALAGVIRYWRVWRGKRDIFARDFTWAWGVFLVALFLSHLRPVLAG